jgi:hypothetical protein
LVGVLAGSEASAGFFEFVTKLLAPRAGHYKILERKVQARIRVL